MGILCSMNFIQCHSELGSQQCLSEREMNRKQHQYQFKKTCCVLLKFEAPMHRYTNFTRNHIDYYEIIK